jgi:hypothetical protein
MEDTLYWMAATYLGSNDGLVVGIVAVAAAAADVVVGVDDYDDVVAVAVAAADVVVVAVAVVRHGIVWMYYFYPDKSYSEIDCHRIRESSALNVERHGSVGYQTGRSLKTRRKVHLRERRYKFDRIWVL